MVNYHCPRCGYETSHFVTFKRHLSRKKICENVTESFWHSLALRLLSLAGIKIRRHSSYCDFETYSPSTKSPKVSKTSSGSSVSNFDRIKTRFNSWYRSRLNVKRESRFVSLVSLVSVVLGIKANHFSMSTNSIQVAISLPPLLYLCWCLSVEWVLVSEEWWKWTRRTTQKTPQMRWWTSRLRDSCTTQSHWSQQRQHDSKWPYDELYLS